MAILYGDRREDGLIRVWRTQHIVPDGQGKTRQIERKDLDKFPDGYWFDEMPDAPAAQVGIDHILYYNPDTEEFTWEAHERALTSEEITAQELPQLKARIAALENGIGTLEAKVRNIEEEKMMPGK